MQFAHVDTTGSLLFVSCRNSFTIFIFAIDPTNGALTNTQRSPFNLDIVQSRGVGNQDIAIGPQGRFLFFVNDESGNEESAFGMALPFAGALLTIGLPGSPVDSLGVNSTVAVEDVTAHFLCVGNPRSGFSIATIGAPAAVAGAPASLGTTGDCPLVLAEALTSSIVVAASAADLSVFKVAADGSLALKTSSAALAATGLALDANTQFCRPSRQTAGLDRTRSTSLRGPSMPYRMAYAHCSSRSALRRFVLAIGAGAPARKGIPPAFEKLSADTALRSPEARCAR